MPHFLFVEEMIQKLNELTQKDHKYHPTIKHITDILTALDSQFLSFEKNYQHIFKDASLQNEATSDAFETNVSLRATSLESKSKLTQEQSESLHKKHHQQLRNSKQNFDSKLKNFEQELITLETQLNEKRHDAQVLRDRDIRTLDNQINKIKKQSAEHILNLETTYKQYLSQLDLKLTEIKQISQDKVEVFSPTIEAQKVVIKKDKNAYREQSDASYIIIKQQFHHSSASLNKRIDGLKRKRDQQLNQIKQDFKGFLTPLEEELTQLQSSYKDMKQNAQQDFKQQMQHHHHSFHKIVDDFEQQKEKITKETNDTITILNSKLSTYKEVLLKERQDQEKTLRESYDNLDDEQQKDLLQIAHNKFVRRQDNELSKQILRTQFDIQAKNRSYYERLYQAESLYLKHKSNWNYQGMLIEFEYKQSGANTELMYQFRLKEINTRIEKVKLNLAYESSCAELSYLKAIAPLEAQLKTENANQERSINILSNDTNFNLLKYQQEEDFLNYEFELFKLNEQATLNLAEIKDAHERKVSSMRLQLNIEKENVLRDYKINKLTLRKEISLHTYDLSIISQQLSYSLDQENILTTKDYTERLHHLEITFQASDYDLKEMLLNHELMYAQHLLVHENLLDKIVRDTQFMSTDLSRLHSRFNYLYNQLFSIYNIHHHFMNQIATLHQIPAHPSDLKAFIAIYLNSFPSLEKIQHTIIDDFMDDMKNYHHEKIDEISNEHYQQSHIALKKEYDNRILSIQRQKQTHTQTIKNIEKQIALLQRNVDKTQNKINQFDQESAKRTQREQQHIQSDIKMLYGQINAFEKDILKFEQNVIAHRNILLSCDKDSEKLSLWYESKNNKLKKDRHYTTKYYQKQLKKYEYFIKQLKRFINRHNQKNKVLTEKLNQPLYLTESIMKNYHRDFQKNGYNFEVYIHHMYHDLLNHAMKLYHKTNTQNKKLERSLNRQFKLQTTQNQKLKSKKQAQLQHMRQTFEAQKQKLLREKDHILNALKEKHTKESAEQVTEIKTLIKNNEDLITSHDERIKSEVKIIDQNLTSVLNQFDQEYQKQINHSKESSQKSMTKMKELIKQKQDNLKIIEKNMHIKADGITSKHAQQIQRIQNHLKEHDASLSKKELKQKQNHHKQILILEQALKLAQKEHVHQLKRNRGYGQQKIKQLEKDAVQKGNIELKDVKKSYQFKQKTLRL